MNIYDSAENYLEAILIIKNEKGTVRSIDIANHLNFSKPSDSDGHISLNESGQKIAEKIYERHTLISNWLMKLGVSPKTASEDACRIEHILSDESFEAIKNHVK